MGLLFSISINYMYISDIFALFKTYRLIEWNHYICSHSVAFMAYLQLNMCN